MRRPLDDQQLELFRARPGDMALRDAQDLMSWPFFSLAKTPRVRPIDFQHGRGDDPRRGDAGTRHGDHLGRRRADLGCLPDRRCARPWSAHLAPDGATPYEILTFIGRGNSALNYDRLKAGLDRLQSTTVATSIRQPNERRRHRFSWINEWKERADGTGRPQGIELILPDWFYAGVMVDALVLTIDRTYFDLTGGLERWLYRLVRKHGGRQQYGWSFDFRHLHLKSGSLSPYKRFAFELRDIVRRQPLPGYQLGFALGTAGQPRLTFQPIALQSSPRRRDRASRRQTVHKL